MMVSFGGSLLALSVSNGTSHQFVYARLHTTLLHLPLWGYKNIWQERRRKRRRKKKKKEEEKEEERRRRKKRKQIRVCPITHNITAPSTVGIQKHMASPWRWWLMIMTCWWWYIHDDEIKCSKRVISISNNHKGTLVYGTLLWQFHKRE